ncbi:hypothetical protein V5P93_004466 [Actinokineospora auranticolor]|uniref:Uncharacterized protein n=1 Tax=Actinokineospora auranticolor TaxID=155976 RepID=A0A2S6GTA5_9PSEU|nr:hypothetical protein [Actinokineospora auranticolor]PPK68426.1 hypothetical protein CLV40_105149 [Actinokineospora auranticolor]
MRKFLPLLLILTACTVPPDPPPVPPSPEIQVLPQPAPTEARRPVDATHLTAAAVFGDLESVDLCQFLKPRDIADFGAAVPDDPAAFDVCAMTFIRDVDRVLVRVRVGPFQRDGRPALRSQALAGGVRKDVVGEDDEQCLAELVFPDGPVLQVAAGADRNSFGGSRGVTASKCPLVDTAIDAMARRFPLGLPSARTFGPGSWHRAHACDLLRPDLVARIPGLAGKQPEQSAAGHACVVRGDGVEARFRFAAGYPLLPTGNLAVTIAGRESVTDDLPRPSRDRTSWCQVSTAHIPHEIPDLPGTSEYAAVEVQVAADRRDTACAESRALAEGVWPGLPG